MNHQRRKQLVEEACGLRGMIAEIQAKTRLYQSNPSAEGVRTSVFQMRNELATYSSRLDEIHEELSSYVVISDVP
jgi:hypothetical protein